MSVLSDMRAIDTPGFYQPNENLVDLLSKYRRFVDAPMDSWLGTR